MHSCGRAGWADSGRGGPGRPLYPALFLSWSWFADSLLVATPENKHNCPVSKQPLIIVTGAAGFIGSALAWRLNQVGRANLLLVDELDKSAKWKNLVPLAYRDYMDKLDFLEAIRSGS